MKKFNLELVKQGHPVISREGEKYSFIGIRDTKKYPLVFISKLDKITVFKSISGKSCLSNNHKDLFLDDSIPWEAPLKEGDVIEVSDGKAFNKRIFISHLSSGDVLCVCDSDHRRYITIGLANIACTSWKKYRRIKSEPVIEITIKINGKKAKLSDISDETLAKLKQL